MFFYHLNICDVSVRKNHTCKLTRRAQAFQPLSFKVTGISQHFMHGRRWTIHSCRIVPVKEGECKPWLRRRKPELSSTVTPTPRGFCFAGVGARPAFSLKPINKGNATSHFPCEHDQASLAPIASQFRVACVFPASGDFEGTSTCCGCARVGFSFFGQKGRQTSWKRGSPSTTIFELSCVELVQYTKIQHGRKRSFAPSFQPLGRFLQQRCREESLQRPTNSTQAER